jgi:hypothetical protein
MYLATFWAFFSQTHPVTLSLFLSDSLCEKNSLPEKLKKYCSRNPHTYSNNTNKIFDPVSTAPVQLASHFLATVKMQNFISFLRPTVTKNLSNCECL